MKKLLLLFLLLISWQNQSFDWAIPVGIAMFYWQAKQFKSEYDQRKSLLSKQRAAQEKTVTVQKHAECVPEIEQPATINQALAPVPVSEQVIVSSAPVKGINSVHPGIYGLIVVAVIGYVLYQRAKNYMKG